MGNTTTSASKAEDGVSIGGHSQLIFWWPIWAYGFFMLSWAFFFPVHIERDPSTYQIFNLIFIFLILFVITFTNLRLPPTFFVIFFLFVVLTIILIKQNIVAKIAPIIFRNLHAHMNFEFYLVMTLGLFFVWLLSLFIYDKSVRWHIRSSQINIFNTFRHADDETINSVNAIFMRKLDDFVCHWILGLGLVGDIYLRLDNGRVEHMKNVLFVRSKSKKIEKAFRPA